MTEKITIDPALFDGFLNSNITKDQLYDNLLNQSEEEIGHDIISYLEGVAESPQKNFLDEILEAGICRLFTEVNDMNGNYFRLESLHESFYVSGVMEVLYKHNSQINKEILKTENLPFTSYCVYLTSYLISQIQQQESLGKELIKPFNRFLRGSLFTRPGTVVFGMGLYLARQGLIKGELSSDNAHLEGYVGLESILRKI